MTRKMLAGTLSALLLLMSVLDAQGQNIVQNPAFTTDLNGWTVVPGPSYTVAWDGTLGHDAPGSALLDLTSSANAADIFFLRQCAPATDSTTYDVEGSFRYPGDVATTPVASLVVQFFSDPACSAPLPGAVGFGLSSLGSPADTWVSAIYPGGLTTPAGAAAVLIHLRLTTFAAGAARGWYDDIRLRPEISCGSPLVVVPDGRLTLGAIPAGGTLWFGATLRAPAGPGIGNSYSLEFTNTSGTAVPPGTLTVFSGDDACGGGSTLATTDNSAMDPAGTGGIARVSFTSSGVTHPFFRARLENGSGSVIPFSFRWSDTTMYSPAWSTNGAFDTFFSFQNTTVASLSGTLTLLDPAGTALSTFPLSIPTGRTVSVNTASLGVARNRTGTARFTHDGPPGAIVAEAAIANFAIRPSYVQPVKFQAVREATR